MGRSVLLTLLVTVGCRSANSVALVPPPVAEVRSNIVRADYAGSAACARCHADIYEEWRLAPMHNMTRLLPGAEVQAPFVGGELRFKDDAVKMESSPAGRFMRIQSSRFGDHLYRVTRVIGGHHREDFAGVEVASTDGEARVLGDPTSERILPASFLLGPRAWRYKGYSVMVTERPGLKVGGEWNRTCVFCHNTIPYFDDLFGALAPTGAGAYQGEVVDALLPPARRWGLEISDQAELGRAVADEMEHLGARVASDGRSPELLRQAVRTTRNRFRGEHLVEVGIGCESCHNGSREHVEHPSVKPSFALRSRFLRAVSPSPPRTAQLINRTCARCHQVLFSRYPYTWEGGRRATASGGSNINSGEARDLLLGHCADELSCVACHDPHAPDNRTRMEALEGRAGDEVCLRCHGGLRGDAAQSAHSHHLATGAGGRCLACHMAKKNLSLETKLSRYHRIGSPTDGERVLGDRPLECALCHAEWSVERILVEMERGFGKRYDRAALRRLYGEDLSVRPLYATLDGGKPHEVAVAAAVLGQARDRDAVPRLVRQLGNPIPLTRGYVLAALEAIVGAPSQVDLHQEVPAIDAAARRWLAAAGVATTGSDERAAVPAAVPAAGLAPADGEE